MTKINMARIFLVAVSAVVLLCLIAGPATAGENDNFLVMYVIGVDLEENSNAATGNLKDLIQTWNPENGKFLVFYGACNKPGWNEGTSVADYESLKADFEEDGVIGSDNGVATTHIISKISSSTGSLAAFSEAIQFTNTYAANNGLENAYRYLIIWDHGSGHLGVGIGNQHLSNDDIGTGLSQSSKKIDMLIYDACRMASLEAAYPVKSYAAFMAASEELEPAAGLNYVALSKAITHSSNSPLDAMKYIADDYLSDNNKEKTYSIIDLSKIDSLVYALDVLGDRAVETFADENAVNAYAYSYKNTEKFGTYQASMDLYNFADLVGSLNSGDLHNAAEDVKNSIRNAVVYNKYNSGHNAANGINIAATSMTSSTVDAIDERVTLSDGGWAKFLKTFVTAANSNYQPQYSTTDSKEGEMSSYPLNDRDAPANITISGDNGLSYVMIDYLYLIGDKYYIVGQEMAEEVVEEAPEGSVWAYIPTGTYTTGDDWNGLWFAFVNDKETVYATLLFDDTYEEDGKEYYIYTISGDLTRKVGGKDVTYPSMIVVYVDMDTGDIIDMWVTSDTQAGEDNTRLNLWGDEDLLPGDKFTPYLDYMTDVSEDIMTEKGKTFTFSADPFEDLQIIQFPDDMRFWDYEIDTITEGSTPVILNEVDFALNNGTITAKPTAQGTNAAKSPIDVCGLLAGLAAAGVLFTKRH